MEYILKENNGKYTPIKYIIKNKCWECISHTPGINGYIKIPRKNKSHWIHRYVYELINGEIPHGKIIMHTCDNRVCINPEHLKIGTYKENTQDMIEKDRYINGMKGKNHTKSAKEKLSKNAIKITEKDLLEIKRLLLENTLEGLQEKDKRIASIFNVSQPTITRIRLGITNYYSDFLNGGLKDWKKKGNK